MASISTLLDRLDELRVSFGPGAAERVSAVLDELEAKPAPNVESLARLHEALLFVRAYPHDAEVRKQAERALARFGRRVGELRDAGLDLEPLEEPDVSGIAGTGISAVFSYGVARDLSRRHARRIEIDWEYYEKPAHLGRALPRLLPLLAEDSLVEAVVPYRAWVEAAAHNHPSSLGWLMERLARLPVERAAEIYDSLELMLRWEWGLSTASRTRTRLAPRRYFYQKTPLLERRDIDFAAELETEPLPVERLSKEEGARVLELMRDTSAVRYRELHGFTFGDEARVLRADAGRGVEIYVTVVPPAHRLPLRAYHGGMFFRNGVPIGYVEGLSLFEHMEVGFNLYYTFREGETAWLYARTARLFRQLAGVECFSVDPYQIGHQNEEAIASGAFWFYRKLGFRPTGTEQAELCRREEERMRKRPGYRTPPGRLRQLAREPLLYEHRGRAAGEWDGFAARNVGLAVARKMAAEYGGDPERMRAAAGARVAEQLGPRLDRVPAAEQLALAINLDAELEGWRPAEKRLAARVIRAKAGPDVGAYLLLMQRHERLRRLFLDAGAGAIRR